MTLKTMILLRLSESIQKTDSYENAERIARSTLDGMKSHREIGDFALTNDPSNSYVTILWTPFIGGKYDRIRVDLKKLNREEILVQSILEA